MWSGLAHVCSARALSNSFLEKHRGICIAIGQFLPNSAMRMSGQLTPDMSEAGIAWSGKAVIACYAAATLYGGFSASSRWAAATRCMACCKRSCDLTRIQGGAPSSTTLHCQNPNAIGIVSCGVSNIIESVQPPRLRRAPGPAPRQPTKINPAFLCISH
jgi:hypothetical protein